MEKEEDENKIFESLIDQLPPINPELEQELRKTSYLQEAWSQGLIDISQSDLVIIAQHPNNAEYIQWKIKTNYDHEQTILLLEEILKQLKRS